MRAAITRFVNDAVVAAGGSISAEHGIGQMKLGELQRLGRASRLSALAAIKRAFDPAGLFNPGKLVPLAPATGRSHRLRATTSGSIRPMRSAIVRTDRYTRGAIAFHWLIAAAIIFNLWLGIWHDGLPREWQVMPVHKAIGITVLALSLARLAWRLTHRPPPLPRTAPAWERAAAHAAHWTLYALTIAGAADRLDDVVDRQPAAAAQLVRAVPDPLSAGRQGGGRVSATRRTTILGYGAGRAGGDPCPGGAAPPSAAARFDAGSHASDPARADRPISACEKA